MQKKNYFLAGILVCASLLAGCDKEENAGNGAMESKGQYVVAASNSDGTASYVSQTGKIDEAGQTLSFVGNGIENNAQRINWMFHRDAVYAFPYNHGDGSKVTCYVLNENGIISKHSEPDLKVSITTRGYYNDDIVILNSSRNLNNPYGTFYFINAVTYAVSPEITVNTAELAKSGGADGKVAYFTDVAQVGDKLYVAWKPVNGTGSGNAHTMKIEIYKMFLSIYHYHKEANTLTLEKTITDNRTGFVSGASSSQAETGISQAENGNVYVFSSAMTDHYTGTNHPSAVLRINKGTEEFDKNYFFNIKEISNGHHLYRVWYMGGTTYVLQMYSQPNQSGSSGVTAYRFAVADVEKNTFAWVSGTPDVSAVTSVSKPYVDLSNKKIAFGISTVSERPRIYMIDAITAKAERGLEVMTDGDISGIGRLNY